MTFSNRNVSKKKKSSLFSKKSDTPAIPYRPSVMEKNLRRQEEKRGKKNDETSKKRGFWGYLKLLFWICFDIGLVIGILLLGWIFYVAMQAPALEELSSSSFSQSSVLYDSSGEKILYELIGNEDRKVLSSIDDISINMRNAMIAAEDAEFYNHKGVSITGIARAVRDSLAGNSTGGSTITQQLIKMVVFANGEEGVQEKVERKIKEISMARKLENKYSKDEILLLYLNKAPFRGNIYGIEKAAEAFFGKSAKDLTVAESAVLAGLPQAPGRYQRVRTSYIDMDQEQMDSLGIEDYSDFDGRSQDIKNSFVRGIFGTEWSFADGKMGYIPGRFDYVLGQMLQKGFISQSEYDQARVEIEDLEIKNIKTSIEAPHFVFYAEEEAERILTELFGEEEALNYIHQQGLSIRTTLDFKLNNEVQRIVAEHGEAAEAYNIRNTAGLVLDSKTGAILSMVGSRDYFAKEMSGHDFDGEVNVITSRRQPGSTFKALAYAAAFELKGFAPASVFMDVKTDFGSSSEPYVPRNYDGGFNGPVSIRKALGSSLNIPAVKAGIIVGTQALYDFTQKFGITYIEDSSRFGASMALGSPVVKPLELGGSFATLANKGKKVETFSIYSITDGNGKVLYERDIETIQQEAEQVVSEETAFLVTDILADESGEGRPESWNKAMSMPNRPSAAKTGTSTGKEGDVTHPHDVWTVGYTPQRTALIWMGNNKGWEGNPKGFLNDNASGLTNAARPWREIMMVAHQDMEVEKFEKPEGIKEISVSTLSGKIPPSGFPEALITKDFFNIKFLPDKHDTSLRVVRLEESSQLLPNEFTPESVIKEYVYIEFHSYFPDNPNWENPVRSWLQNNGAKLANSLGISNIIPFVPKEYTDKYSKDTKRNSPRIAILSPSNMGIVSPPRINVEVDTRAANGVKQINLYWDGTLVATKKEEPWIFTIPLEESKVGSLHVLEGEVIDTLDYTGNVSVNVKVGEDIVPPDVAFLYPQAGENVIAGSLVQVGVDAIDRNSSIKSVEFYLDNEHVKTMISRPYQFSWLASGAEGGHVFKAIVTDESGNKATESVSFTVGTERIVDESPFIPNANPDNVPQIESGAEGGAATPAPTTTAAVETERVLGISKPLSGEEITGTIPISFTVPKRMRTAGISVSVLAREIGGKKQSIFSIAGSDIPASGVVSFSWTPSVKTEYSLYLEVVGNVRDFSSKVRVIAK